MCIRDSCGACSVTRIVLVTTRRRITNTTTFLRVRVIDALKLGDLEAHHMGGGFAHELLLVFGVGVLGNHVGGHRRVFLVGNGVHREKLDLLIVEAVVFL